MNNITNKKKNITPNKRISITIIIILLIITIITSMAFFFLTKPKNIFIIATNTFFDYIEFIIPENGTIGGDFSLKASGSSNNTKENELLTLLTKIEVLGTYKIDYENKLIDLEINSNYEEDKLVNGNIYLESGNAYLYLNDLYDKYIEIPLDKYDSIFNGYNKKEDYIIVLDKIRNTLKSSLKDEYFTKESTTLNGKEVDKITLVLNKDNRESLSNDIFTTLEKDNLFLSSLSNILDISITEVKELLNSYKDKIDDYKDMNISFYFNNKDISNIEISNLEGKIIISIDHNNYNILLYDEDIIIYEINITINEDNYDISIKNIIDESHIEIYITNKPKYDVNIERKDISSSVNYKEIPISDKIGIYGNILSNENLLNFISDLSLQVII